MLGDIALAWETCRREAEEKRIPLEHHAAHLLVHGMLHLAGHDHQADSEAETMEALEIRALAQMGIADPYGNG
jgi:probable rRNA maturation factor